MITMIREVMCWCSKSAQSTQNVLHISLLIISNGNSTEWSPIQAVII